jgi:hypothetical protein
VKSYCLLEEETSLHDGTIQKENWAGFGNTSKQKKESDDSFRGSVDRQRLDK